MAGSVFAVAQSRRGKNRAALWRQIGFPNVKLANNARRETWKRYHELLARFPSLRAEQALLLARKDHREQYEELMHGATRPQSQMQGEEIFNPFGPSFTAAGAVSETPGTLHIGAPTDQQQNGRHSPVAGIPRWWESIKGFEALALALDSDLNDLGERTAALTKMLLKSESAERGAARRHAAKAERLKRERLKLKAGARATDVRIAAVKAELARLRSALERGALVMTAQEYRAIAPRVRKRIRDGFREQTG
jgi:hypothetical protein